MAEQPGAEDTRILTRKLGWATVLMFGFGFALWPLYNVFCNITGINGKTGQVSEQEVRKMGLDPNRTVTVHFDGTVNSRLPWQFWPAQGSMEVHPGKVYEASYLARNQGEMSVVGNAVPSVAPSQASLYFNKTECFCFTAQRLEPGESKEMPLRFIIDPALPDGIREVTLSYTFFKNEEQTQQANQQHVAGKAGNG